MLPSKRIFSDSAISGNLNNSIEFNIYYYGAFEKPLLFFLRDALQNLQDADANAGSQRQLFCDVGSNIGQHSLFMSNYASHVHAFEPYGLVSAKMNHHIQLNGIENISFHAVGLSDKAEALTFFAPTGRNQGIGSFDASTVSKGNNATGKLMLLQGDEYFQEHKIDAIALMKIDVEGFEKSALTGLRRTLLEQRPVLVCEISYGGELAFTSLEEFLAVLPPDYKLFAFNTRNSDGSKAKRRGSKAKRSGEYELIEFSNWRHTGQDDIIACPAEKAALLPPRNL